MYRRTFLILAAGAGGCGSRTDAELTVAAAANLVGVFDQIGRAFTRETGVPVTITYGATSMLAQQIRNGAPYDVFASADSRHPDELAREGATEHPAIYARGRLALIAPRATVKTLADLAKPEVRFIAIARPASAPYGAAAVEALRNSGLWERVEPKIVYAPNVNMTREYVGSGSAEAALTAWSLVMREPSAVLVDPGLHTPINQAIAVVARSPRREQARRFMAFVLGPAGQSLLAAHGYGGPR